MKLHVSDCLWSWDVISEPQIRTGQYLMSAQLARIQNLVHVILVFGFEVLLRYRNGKQLVMYTVKISQFVNKMCSEQACNKLVNKL